MMRLTVRTGDGALAAALAAWQAENAASLPDGAAVLTDLDTTEPLRTKDEITCAHGEGADLMLPLSFSELKELLLLRAGEGSKRLCFSGESFFLDGEALSLSPLEKRILSVLYEARGVCSPSAIAGALGEDRVRSNKIGVYISYIRKKTARPGRAPLIRTIRGEGYLIDDE